MCRTSRCKWVLKYPCSNQVLVSTPNAVSLIVSKCAWLKSLLHKTRSKDCFAVLHEKIWDSVKWTYKVDVIILYDLCFGVCVNRNELEVVFMLSYTVPHSAIAVSLCTLSPPTLSAVAFYFVFPFLALPFSSSSSSSSPFLKSSFDLCSFLLPSPALPCLQLTLTVHLKGKGLGNEISEGRGRGENKVFTMQNAGGGEDEDEDEEKRATFLKQPEGIV